MPRRSALWLCKECGEKFTVRNQWHSCGRFSLEDLFAGCEPATKRLLDRFAEAAENCGPVRIIPQKTRITFQVRMRFAAIFVRKRYLRRHFVLARRREEPFIERIVRYSPRNYVHEFRLDNEEQINETFLNCLCEAYKVGRQEHLESDDG